MPDQHPISHNVRIAMKEIMTSLPYPVLTVTFDNGMEFAAHQNIAEDLKPHIILGSEG